ncbi:hypothetical protein RC62_3994 [Flavobacterium aquidurense]|uniref:Uncharacterized protein n=1 Tax=Flavobacterium aquidurense TaxID=362413 RepID=A0A0Q0WZL5_9FLAO|nr:hypothetical protein RC62_3994 [Flavobacterium aquidurense]
MKVAVPSPQHSPILGQLPEVQMVFKLYLSTKPRSSVYFCPIGSLTFNHLGFPSGTFSMTVSIYQYSKHKDKECSLFVDSFKI